MKKSDAWVQTYSGKKFFPLDPKLEDICIEDIAHALSNICRFNGHCKEFYSVALHSVLVCDQVSKEAKPFALLHDASEAYLCDIARPIKSKLPSYVRKEDKIQSLIFEKFTLWNFIPSHLAEEIHVADLRLLATERRDLMNCSEPWPGLEGIEPYTFDIKELCLEPIAGKGLFLNYASCFIGK